MSVKLETLINGIQGLRHLANLKLKTSTSFKVGTFLRQCQPHLTMFSEKEMELNAAFTVPIDPANPKAGEHIADIAGYHAQKNELLDVELADLHPPQLALSTFDDLPVVPLSISLLCGWILTDLPDNEKVTIEMPINTLYDMYDGLAQIGQTEMLGKRAHVLVPMLWEIRQQLLKYAKHEQVIQAEYQDLKDKTNKAASDKLLEYRKQVVPVTGPRLPLAEFEDLTFPPSAFVNLGDFVTV